MPDENQIDTRRIARVVRDHLHDHKEACPAHQNYQKLEQKLDDIPKLIQDNHQTMMDKWNETEKKMLKGEFQFQDHERRIEAQEEKTEGYDKAIRGLVIKILTGGAVIAGSGTGIYHLIAGFLGG